MVSVVVPIYRVEKYLRKCVDSLLQQTYKNIEIILVDDGSPDACPEICDELKKTDDRIVVIQKRMVDCQMLETLEFRLPMALILHLLIQMIMSASTTLKHS